MSDLLLTTKIDPNNPPSPPQNFPSNTYFGEQSNDLQINQVNDFATISGTTKLVQDVNKIFLTELGSNTNFPLYGTTLQSMIGQKMNLGSIQATVKDQIIGALQVLQFVNQTNPNKDEVPNILQSLVITQPEVNQIQVTLSIITLAGTTVSTSISLSTGG